MRDFDKLRKRAGQKKTIESIEQSNETGQPKQACGREWYTRQYQSLARQCSRFKVQIAVFRLRSHYDRRIERCNYLFVTCSARAEITFPSVVRDLLMLAPSFRRLPFAPVDSALSLPAKSTRLILLT